MQYIYFFKFKQNRHFCTSVCHICFHEKNKNITFYSIQQYSGIEKIIILKTFFLFVSFYCIFYLKSIQFYQDVLIVSCLRITFRINITKLRNRNGRLFLFMSKTQYGRSKRHYGAKTKKPEPKL